MANLENYSAETTEKVQNTQNSKFDFQSRNSAISATVEAGDIEHDQASQEADDLLDSIDNPQQPLGKNYVLLSSQNLSPKEIKERSEWAVDDFNRTLKSLIDRKNASKERKQDTADFIASMFVPGGTITYKNEIINVSDLYNKIEDGTINGDFLINKSQTTLSEYAYVSDVTPVNGDSYHLVRVLLQNVTIYNANGWHMK